MVEELDAAARLRDLWLGTGLSISQFADLLGEKRQRVKDILGGRQRLPADVLLRLPHKLPVNMQWFMGDDQEPMFNPGAPYPVPSTVSRSERMQYLGVTPTESPELPESAREQLAAYNVDPGAFVFIRHYDIKASMGLGFDNGDSSEGPKQYNAFRRSFWQREIGFAPVECFSMDLGGTSMYPFLTDRHVPIFHREETVSTDSVYCFRYQKELYVKWLDRVPGQGLNVRSEDPQVRSWMITDHIGDEAQKEAGDEPFKVIGRLVFKQLGEKV